MTKVRTYVDASVLIAVVRGKSELAARALAVINDSNRQFAASDFLRLELLPKPRYNKIQAECQFYDGFFAKARPTIHASRKLAEEAEHEAVRYGLSAIDAFHIVCAKRARCGEVITAEKPTKPLFRVKGLRVTSIYLK